jgi:hypothetical protein
MMDVPDLTEPQDARDRIQHNVLIFTAQIRAPGENILLTGQAERCILARSQFKLWLVVSEYQLPKRRTLNFARDGIKAPQYHLLCHFFQGW